MKIIDMQEVENGYCKLSITNCIDNSIKNNTTDITFYYRNKEQLINAINSESLYDMVLFADIVIDDKNSKLIKSKFDCKIPVFADLVFYYIQNET